MPDTTSPVSSTAPTDPSPSATPAVVASPTSAPTTSPETLRDSGQAAALATAAAPQSTPPKVRPEGLPDSFWDKDKSEIKLSDFTKSYEELRQAKAEVDARRALIPAQPDLYKPELPKDLKLPQGMEVKTDDPLYLSVRDMAHAKGWTQADFSDAIGVYAKIEAAKQETLQSAIKARDEALGVNGPQRVDDLKKWFNATFGETIGQQFSQTLFTPSIISGFEKMRDALSRQGVRKFDASGREAVEGRTDGRPDNWESLTALDRRMWNLEHRDGKAA